MKAPHSSNISLAARILRNLALRLELAGELHIERNSCGEHVSYRLTEEGRQRLQNALDLQPPV